MGAFVGRATLGAEAGSQNRDSASSIVEIGPPFDHGVFSSHQCGGATRQATRHSNQRSLIS